MARYTLTSPLDMHLHLREGNMLKLVSPLSAASFAGAVIMPNLVPPVTTLSALLAYKEAIEVATQGVNPEFQPLMTLFFRPYTREELEADRPFIVGLKLYPAGATTNSEGGVKGMEEAYPTLALMEELGIALLVHGESHGFVLDREEEFLGVYERLAQDFPRLTIIMEHITTAGAVRLLDAYPNLYATVTLQHLLITLDDVAGGMLKPHLFCKPIAKRPEDRDALLAAALSGHPKLMFGSDSAPHPKHKKECCGCAAGVFTAPLALLVLTDLFVKNNAFSQLEAFVSWNARRIYGLEHLPVKKVVIEDGVTRIPAQYEGFGESVVPMYAGESLPYRFVKGEAESH